jgi:hypothetical protein
VSRDGHGVEIEVGPLHGIGLSTRSIKRRKITRLRDYEKGITRLRDHEITRTITRLSKGRKITRLREGDYEITRYENKITRPTTRRKIREQEWGKYLEAYVFHGGGGHLGHLPYLPELLLPRLLHLGGLLSTSVVAVTLAHGLLVGHALEEGVVHGDDEGPEVVGPAPLPVKLEPGKETIKTKK